MSKEQQQAEEFFQFREEEQRFEEHQRSIDAITKTARALTRPSKVAIQSMRNFGILAAAAGESLAKLSEVLRKSHASEERQERESIRILASIDEEDCRNTPDLAAEAIGAVIGTYSKGSN